MSMFLRCFNNETKGAEGAKDLLMALASSKELEEPFAPLPIAHCASMSKPSCSFAFVGASSATLLCDSKCCMGSATTSTVAQAEEGEFARVPRPVEWMFVDQYVSGGRAEDFD